MLRLADWLQLCPIVMNLGLRSNGLQSSAYKATGGLGGAPLTASATSHAWGILDKCNVMTYGWLDVRWTRRDSGQCSVFVAKGAHGER